MLNLGVPWKQSQVTVKPELLHEIPLAQHRHTLAFLNLKQKHRLKIRKLKMKIRVPRDHVGVKRERVERETEQVTPQENILQNV